MSLIKSPYEVIREKCTEELASAFKESVRPVYGSTQNGSPSHIGSCIFISVNSKKYLITAAHIIDASAITMLYTAGAGSDLVSLSDQSCLLTPKVDGERDKDRFDFSVVKLSDVLIQNLKSVSYISEDQMLLNGPGHNYFLALGYPTSQNKKINVAAKKVTQNPLAYLASRQTNEEIFSKIGIKEETHFLLKYEKYSKNATGNKANTPPPCGISGGGLFYLSNLTSPEIYRLGNKCIGKLAGLLIEHHKQHKVITAVRMSLIISEIKKRKF